ncbi:hypothetical protein [Rheinheimera sp.]|uniref:hypothetical protein n=1 Tax=Rheinheimera sp. TaxID=1869214 RepID=UPI00307CD51F
MIRLSKTSWNNVLIYAVLVLIGLFVILPEYWQRDAQSAPTRLVSATQTLLALHYPAHQVERAGPAWRVQPAVLSQAQLQQLVDDWQQGSLASPSPLNPIRPVLRSEVAAWLTGKPAQQHWQLYQAQEQWWLKAVDADLWFRLSETEAEQLFPTAVR